jgi:hypothetical protein
MMKAIAYALLLTAVITTGCARMRGTEPSASPSTNPSTDKVSCEASGGKWNAFTKNCDR